MTFSLEIVTPDGLIYKGEAEMLSVRTADGVIGILPRHIDYVAPLGMGEAVIKTPDGPRRAACIGGMVAVHNGMVRLVERAKTAENKARSLLSRSDLSERDLKLAEARLRRALVRQSVGKGR